MKAREAHRIKIVLDIGEVLTYGECTGFRLIPRLVGVISHHGGYLSPWSWLGCRIWTRSYLDDRDTKAARRRAYRGLGVALAGICMMQAT